jgi:hypothetical protein
VGVRIYSHKSVIHVKNIFFPIKVQHIINCNSDDTSSFSSGSRISSEIYTDRDFNANEYDEVLQRRSIFSKNQVNFSEFRQFLHGMMSLKQKVNNEDLEFSYEDKLLEIYGKILNILERVKHIYIYIS